jgi:hypothetical protein
MVSTFGSQQKDPKGQRTTWIFRFKNRNLRVVQASRTFTTDEHSINRFETGFRSLSWMKEN